MEINNILVTGRMYKEVQSILEGKNTNKNIRFLSEEKVVEGDFDWADAFVSFKPTQVFQLEKLKWVHSFGAGVDGFLFDQKWNEDVLLTRTICSFGQKIGEYCLSYILRDLQFHQEFANNQTKKKWDPISPKPLQEQTIIIFGTGAIGQEVAALFTSLGMAVFGVSLSGKQKHGFKKVYTFNDETVPLKEANFVISTLPLTALTKHLFDDKLFNRFDDAVFINVGRGATIEDVSLINALDKGTVKHAVLDVFKEEPLPVKSPLWTREDITLTPHISAITSPREAVECFWDTLEKIEAKQPLGNQVDVQKGF